MANTSAIWQQAAHTTDQLSCPSLMCSFNRDNIEGFIIFRLERQKRVQANELCIIVLLLVFKFIMFYHILFHLT